MHALGTEETRIDIQGRHRDGARYSLVRRKWEELKREKAKVDGKNIVVQKRDGDRFPRPARHHISMDRFLHPPPCCFCLSHSLLMCTKVSFFSCEIKSAPIIVAPVP